MKRFLLLILFLFTLNIISAQNFRTAFINRVDSFQQVNRLKLCFQTPSRTSYCTLCGRYEIYKIISTQTSYIVKWAEKDILYYISIQDTVFITNKFSTEKRKDWTKATLGDYEKKYNIYINGIPDQPSENQKIYWISMTPAELTNILRDLTIPK